MVYKKITINTNDVFGGRQIRIHRVVLVAGADVATAVLEDAVAAGSNDFWKSGNVAAATKVNENWGDKGLVVNYVSITLTGTSPILYLYYS